MPVSKAQQKAVHKYVKSNYDRLELTVPKGRKEAIKAFAKAQGQSVNGYINAAIDARMTASEPGSVLAPNALCTAQEAARAAGETVPQFVTRAVETQARRDALARKMKEEIPNE